MKRLISGIILVTLLLFAAFPVIAEGMTLNLPSGLLEIEDQAFEGNVGITSIVIPQATQFVGARAFANCSNLRDVYVGDNITVQFASDSFSGCDKSLVFHVYSDSSAEQFAHKNGFQVEIINQGPVIEPPQITTSTQGNYLVVNWTSVSGVDKYTYQWAYNSTENITAQYTVRYTDIEEPLSTMSAGTWYIRVKAVLDDGETAWSEWHSIVIPENGQAIKAPTLTSITLNTSNTYVTVKWTTVTNATGYKVFYGTSTNIANATTKQVTGQSSSSTSINVDAGETYYFWVKAYNASGDSDASNRKSVNVPEPCTLSLSKSTWRPDYSADEVTITVTCDSTFSVEASKSWIDYEISGNKIYVNVSKNTGSSIRTGYLYVTCDKHTDETVQLKIVQDYNDADPLEVTISADNSTILQHSNFNLHAEASGGTGTYQYQWYYATSSTGTGTKSYTGKDISFEGTLDFPTFWYYCVVTSGSQTATSNRLQLNVVESIGNPTLEVEISAEETTILQHSNFNLHAEASGGTGAYQYQWYYATSSTETGTATYTGASISFEGTLDFTPIWYYCVVTDSSGNTATSDRLKLTVVESLAPVLEVEISAEETTILQHSNFNLHAEASGGTGTYQYQWYYATSSTGTGTKSYTGKDISFEGTLDFPTFWYYCVVTSGSQTATSNRLQLNVVESIGDLVFEAPTLTSITLNTANTYVTVKWTTVSNATGYKVFYGTSTNITNATTKQVTGQSSSSTSINVDAGETYYFWVKAYNASGDSEASNRKSVEVPESCTLSLSKSTWRPDYSADEVTITVTCESSFSVKASKSWIDYEISGNKIYVSVSKNTGSSSRTGYLYVTCDEHTDETVQLKIVQDYNDADPLEVTISADSTTIRQHSDFCLYAEASGGTGTYRKYQWYYATSSTGTGKATYTGDSISFEGTLDFTPMWYYCVVTDSSGNAATSNRLKLTVTE